MSKIYCTGHCPFSFEDWENQNIKEIFAGRDTVMALTEEGRLLQKISDPRLAAMPEFWYNVKTISISQFFPGLAIGLRNDGTCVVTRRALENAAEIAEVGFNRIMSEIKKLRDIVEISVSDAVFALDSSGKMHHIEIWSSFEKMYKLVDGFSGITRLRPGMQDALFGITDEGKILGDGTATTPTAKGIACDLLKDYDNVIDVCPTGTDLEGVFVALSDGRVMNYLNEVKGVEHCGAWPVFFYTYSFVGVRLKENKIKCLYSWHISNEEKEIIESRKIDKFTVGINSDYKDFAVWTEKERVGLTIDRFRQILYCIT